MFRSALRALFVKSAPMMVLPFYGHTFRRDLQLVGSASKWLLNLQAKCTVRIIGGKVHAGTFHCQTFRKLSRLFVVAVISPCINTSVHVLRKFGLTVCQYVVLPFTWIFISITAAWRISVCGKSCTRLKTTGSRNVSSLGRETSRRTLQLKTSSEKLNSWRNFRDCLTSLTVKDTTSWQRRKMSFKCSPAVARIH